MDHVPSPGDRQLLEGSTVRLAMRNRIQATWNSTYTRPAVEATSALTSLLTSRLLLLTSRPTFALTSGLLLTSRLLLTGRALRTFGVRPHPLTNTH